MFEILIIFDVQFCIQMSVNKPITLCPVVLDLVPGFVCQEVGLATDRCNFWQLPHGSLCSVPVADRKKNACQICQGRFPSAVCLVQSAN